MIAVGKMGGSDVEHKEQSSEANDGVGNNKSQSLPTGQRFGSC